MRIAILTSGILPIPAYYGGAVENLIDYYLDYNNKLGLHDIDVYSVRPSGVEYACQAGRVHYRYVDVTSFLARARRRLHKLTAGPGYYNYFIDYFLHRCLQMMAGRVYDLVLLENRPGFAIAVRRLTPAKIVLHLHFDNLNSATYCGREICNSLSAVIGVSDYICKKVGSIGYTLPAYTVHNGIDRELFVSAEPARREDFGLRDDDFVLVFSGRVAAIKGIGELVHAMTGLSSQPQVKLLVVGGSFYGGGVEGDTDFYETLKCEASSLGNRIVFTGFRPYKEIPSLLKMADVAVVPSTCQEAFATTILEAMAAGLPILCTRSGGVPEACAGIARIVEQGEGLAERLRMNIEDLCLHPDVRKSMSQLGLEHSILFTREHYAAEFIATLERICQ